MHLISCRPALYSAMGINAFRIWKGCNIYLHLEASNE